jgi:hypothetical protein
LFVHLGAFLLGALTLAAGVAIRSGTGPLPASQPFDHGAGFGAGYFARNQGCHFLHRRRGTTPIAQTEGMVGRETPLSTAPTPPPQPFDATGP